jgi:8-oxo-dGTP pyrophosphatase MutT (NUDIX family)
MAQKHLTAGAVIFRPAPEGPRFLLIRNAKGHWDFPKGHIEPGETRVKAARREVREESGISRFTMVPGFREKRLWKFRQDGLTISKECTFFLGRAGSGRIKLSREHTRGGWFTLAGALKTLPYPGQRSLIRKAASVVQGRQP